ncbi:phage major capsid protein, partial [Candidatus Babeliales bacterium]|nr:phage major capsid protein [Candidatus Babeliales bacterium]
VDYNKIPGGDVVKAIHDLHDAELILNAYSKHRERFKSGAEVQKDMSRIKESLVKLINYYDPSIDTKAFSTGTSSYGSDWALTIPSPQMFDLYDLNRGLEAEFTHYTLKGKTDTYPLKTSHGHAWSADTAASNNPDRYKKTDITTGAVVFTAGKMTYDVVADEEGIEGDSIVQIVPILRQEIAFGLADGMEDALINGDNTATHQDTGLTATDMYTRDRFMGLRWKAAADSKTFDTQSSSATVGDGTTAFTAKDVRYLRILADKMGVKPSEFRYVVPINGYFKMLNMTEFSQPGTYGSGASWLTGYLNNADGVPLIISEHMWNNMNTSGVYDNSTKTHSGILGFNKTGFVVGDRRLMMIEFEKDIHTGQWSFVGSIRKDFQKVVASTLYPVAYGYKITT